MTPATGIVKTKTTRHLLAGSRELNFNSTGESGSGQLINSNATGTGLSRHSSIWDDDEEE